MDEFVSTLTWAEEVRALGILLGVALSDEEIHYILVTKTSFPVGTTSEVLADAFQWIAERYPEYEQKRLV